MNNRRVSDSSTYELRKLAQQGRHQLRLSREGRVFDVELETRPQELPPIVEVPPFWTVGVEALHQAPNWARSHLFGHSSPAIGLVNIDGGFVTGRSFYGKAHLIVYFFWSTPASQRNAISFLEVLQQAQPALNKAGIDVLAAHLNRSGRDHATLNDTDLLNLRDAISDKYPNFPPVPMYRTTNAREGNVNRELGLEGTYSVQEGLRYSPAILILDQYGVVRWHSEGTFVDPNNKLPPAVYTIDAAARWALEML